MFYREISENDFIRGFDEYGRSDNFSVEARKTLYEFFCEVSEDSTIEFDPIAICCEFTEYDTPEDLIFDYGYIADLPTDAPATQENIAIMEEILDDNTLWWRLQYGGYLIQSF